VSHIPLTLLFIASLVLSRVAHAYPSLVQCAESESTQCMTVSLDVPGRGSPFKSEFFFKARDKNSRAHSKSKLGSGFGPAESGTISVYVDDTDTLAIVKLEQNVITKDANSLLSVEVRVPYLQPKSGAIAGVSYEIGWRATSPGPNKSLQPTATAVMPPAAQEIMPAVAVAEH
jgi:hypothetical protein